MSTPYYVGVMSGTSLDGVDCVVVSLDATPTVIASSTVSYPHTLYQKLQALPETQTIETVAQLDVALGKFFAVCINRLLADHELNATEVRAIGLHGQTIDHQPEGEHPYTVQIGDANIVAHQTGILTVADFRRKDIAAGGQGAPLAPAFHQAIFADSAKNTVVLNIGGIANISYLPAQGEVLGFDTGPGNGLLDAWVQQHLQKLFDAAGAWAASGQVNQKLLTQLLAEPYFAKPAPKSTGREFFNLDWLARFDLANITPQDVQATLSQLSTETIAESVQALAAVDQVLVCGGGVQNTDLMQRLQQALPNMLVCSTADLGVDPDMVEAMAFAWLAKQTMEGKPGNLPSVTGAKSPQVLGAIYSP